MGGMSMGPLISDSRSPQDKWPWEHEPGDSGSDRLGRILGTVLVVAFFVWAIIS